MAEDTESDGRSEGCSTMSDRDTKRKLSDIILSPESRGDWFKVFVVFSTLALPFVLPQFLLWTQPYVRVEYYYTALYTPMLFTIMLSLAALGFSAYYLFNKVISSRLKDEQLGSIIFIVAISITSLHTFVFTTLNKYLTEFVLSWLSEATANTVLSIMSRLLIFRADKFLVSFVFASCFSMLLIMFWRKAAVFYIQVIGVMCLLLSPLSLVYTAQAMAYDTIPQIAKMPKPSEGSTAAPTFIIVFDALDDEIVAGNDSGMLFPSFSEYRKNSVRFKDAKSIVYHTEVVIPALLFQQKSAGSMGSDGYRTFEDGTAFSDQSLKTAFGILGNGERNIASGFRLNYHNMLAAHGVDVICDTPMDIGGLGVSNNIRAVLSRLDASENPYFPAVTRLYDMPPEDQHVHEFTSLQFEQLFFLGEDPAGAVAFFHICPPHFPNIYNANGLKSDNNNSHSAPAGPDQGYIDNLAYVDKQLGKFIKLLKASGWYDKSTIVVMGDHNRHWDGPGSLAVKLPFQKEGRDYKGDMATYELAHWIRKQPAFQKAHPELFDN